MNENSVGEARDAAVGAAMNDIQQIETEQGVTRESVDAIRQRLLKLANQRDLFPLDDFPAPGADAEQSNVMYRLAQGAQDRFALYAQSGRGTVETPPHNHTTWAVIVGFHGQELNKFYQRTADGGVEQTGQFIVEAGSGVAMLAEDLHSIHIEGSGLNFHCYGLALERLDQRQYYSESSGEWKIFSAVGEIREARTNLQSC